MDRRSVVFTETWTPMLAPTGRFIAFSIKAIDRDTGEEWTQLVHLVPEAKRNTPQVKEYAKMMRDNLSYAMNRDG